MDFRAAIAEYQESNGMVSIYKNPAPRSTDNGLLFTATYLALLGSSRTGGDTADFFKLALSCEIEPGLLARYPGEKTATSHDDMTGVASASWTAASRILAYFDREPDEAVYLSRIIDFFPSLQAAAGARLSIADQVLFCAALIANCFEHKSATSGKCLIYLKAKMVEGKYPLCDAAIALWRLAQKIRYPGGMKDVYAIYFGATHPFAVFGPEDFA